MEQIVGNVIVDESGVRAGAGGDLDAHCES